MAESGRLTGNIQALVRAAQILKVPIIHTEQVPEKIGRTIPAIDGLLKGQDPVRKSSFSCFGSKEFAQKWAALDRSQVIVAGIETHVCVYQTVADLLSRKFEVQIVADAVSSRSPDNKAVALDLVKSLGAVVTTTEMIICELIRGADHEDFKDIIALVKSCKK